MGRTKRNHAAGETENLLGRLEIVPIIPTRSVVLAIGIVVATLGAPQFVWAQQHRHTPRGQQGQEEVLDLTLSEGFHARIGRLALRAVILTEILVHPILMVLTVGFIVLVAITHQIV
jgi:hypothetical protein